MSKLIFYLDFGQDCVFSTLNITEGGTTGSTTWWWWYPHLPTPCISLMMWDKFELKKGLKFNLFSYLIVI